jgi:hypothetical protein
VTSSFVVSCDECVMRGTETCDDCIVTFLCERDPDEAVVIDAFEERALRLLNRAGLLPPLQHRRRTC